MIISLYKSRIANINCVIATYYNYLKMKRILVIVYNFYFSSQLIKLILTLFKMKKDVTKANFMLKSANYQVFSKNSNFSSF